MGDKRIFKKKIWPEDADAVWCGEKTAEVRYDEGYAEGDIIEFWVRDADDQRIWHPLNGQQYKITYVLRGIGLMDGYVMLCIKKKGGK